MTVLDGVATAWSPLLVAAALVVLVAGVAKIRTPSATAGLLRPLLGDAARPAAVALGVVEVAVGAAALTLGSTAVAGALAGTYGAFFGISLGVTSSAATAMPPTKQTAAANAAMERVRESLRITNGP